MGHTFTKLIVHAVFSPKDREHIFTPAIRKELYPFIGGVLKNIDCVLLGINGTEDHVHVCADFPAKIAVAELLGKVKANSSRWLKGRFRVGKFEWQEGYGAFTVSESKLDTVKEYIARQEEHHRKMTFKEELAWFCKNHGLPAP
jgi:REP element-mobilizing transposase RayT